MDERALQSILARIGELTVEVLRGLGRTGAGGHLRNAHAPPREIAVDHGFGQHLDVDQGRYRLQTRIGQRPMQLLKQLFTTEVGLFSAVGIGFMLCMLVFFVWLFTRNDAPPADQKQP